MLKSKYNCGGPLCDNYQALLVFVDWPCISQVPLPYAYMYVCMLLGEAAAVLCWWRCPTVCAAESLEGTHEASLSGTSCLDAGNDSSEEEEGKGRERACGP